MARRGFFQRIISFFTGTGESRDKPGSDDIKTNGRSPEPSPRPRKTERSRSLKVPKKGRNRAKIAAASLPARSVDGSVKRREALSGIFRTVIPRDMNKICVLCKKEHHLQAAVETVQNLLSSDLTLQHVTVIGKKIRSGTKEELQSFEGAGLVLLVAIAAGRMLIISDVEESQLGVAYNEAQSVMASVLLILTDHHGSGNLADHQLYPRDMVNLFVNQPSLGSLATIGRFISIGPVTRERVLPLNKTQQQALAKWIKEKGTRPRSRTSTVCSEGSLSGCAAL